MQIDGTAAIVTGGASGLGEASARALAAEGSEVTLLDLNDDRGKAVAADIGGRYARCDVTSEQDVLGAISEATSGGKPLRIAVNCAGIGTLGRILNKDGTAHSLELFTKTIMVNLVGTANVLRLAANAMKNNDPANADGERGVIVNTASIAAFDGQIGQFAYAASKGGVVSLTLTAARDLASFGVRVMTIAPGTFLTPMLMGLPDQAKESLAAAIPFPKRLGDPAEFGKLVTDICELTELNGEVIRLDGALRMAPR